MYAKSQVTRASTPHPGTEPRHVLIVMSDIFRAATLAEVLVASGFFPHLAQGTREAARILSSSQPLSAVLLDQRLPASGAENFFRMLSVFERAAELPVLLLARAGKKQEAPGPLPSWKDSDRILELLHAVC